MSAWVFIPLVLVALIACPLSMWVMGRVTRRKVSCAMCGMVPQENHTHDRESLEARKAAIEKEIAELRSVSVRSGGPVAQVNARDGRGG